MYLAIDNRRVIRQPHQIEIVPYEHATGMTADGTPTVKPGSNYVQLNCTFGADLSYQDVLGELDRLRANRGVHSVTFEPMRGCQNLTINAYMGKPRVTHVGYTNQGKIVTSSFVVPFIQVDTTTYLYPIRFRLDGILSVLSPWYRRTAPAAGRVVAVDGCIRDLGAGGGNTSVQLHNETAAVDYLSTEGDFVCGAPVNYRLQNAVLGTNLDFDQDDELWCNITDTPVGGMSRDALVTLWAWLYHP